MSNPNASAERVKVGVQLNIDDAGELTRITVVPYEDETGDHIQVLAEGIEASPAGALAVVAIMEQACAAIRSELGAAPTVAPSRPRFNPQPRGGK